ncbi:MAG: hypothetical protein K2L64_03240, partial [Ureaplasma sp.]|nr:hypothetical protein [Ureaplasma sp.]
MEIKIEKHKLDDEMLISFCVPFELYKKSYLSRQDYILDLVAKSSEKNRGKSHKKGEDYVDNLGLRVILDTVKTLNLEDLLEKELTDKEKDGYQLVKIDYEQDIEDMEDSIFRINFIFLETPIIKNNYDYKNISLPITLPETNEWYLEYISSLLFECGLLTKSSVTKLTNRHYGVFKCDLYTIDSKTKEYKLIDKDLEVKTFYEFDKLAKNVSDLRNKLKNMSLNETREFI